jgi:hypothetical protein
MENEEEEVAPVENEVLAEAENRCPVCYEAFDPIKTIQFGCGHRYCSACAMKWLNDGRGTCPYCTQRVVDEHVGRFRGHPRINALRLFMGAIFVPLGRFLAPPFFLLISALDMLSNVIVAINHNMKWISLALVMLWLCLCVQRPTTPSTRNESSGNFSREATQTMDEIVEIISPVVANLTRTLTASIAELEARHAGESSHLVFVVAKGTTLYLEIQTAVARLFQLVVNTLLTLKWPTYTVDEVLSTDIHPAVVILQLLWKGALNFVTFTIDILTFVPLGWLLV